VLEQVRYGELWVARFLTLAAVTGSVIAMYPNSAIRPSRIE